MRLRSLALGEERGRRRRVFWPPTPWGAMLRFLIVIIRNLISSMSKRTPLLEGRLSYRVKRLERALRASMEDALRGAGISAPQYTTMVALEAHPGSSNATLSRICFVTPQTMNELIQGLEAGSLVERLEGDVDRREIALQLTDEGRRRLTAGHKQILEVEAAALAPLSEAQRRSFLDHLDACSATLEGGQRKRRAIQKPLKRGRTRRPGRD
jgi:DNA-binding MarR family transcriptional regulator